MIRLQPRKVTCWPPLPDFIPVNQETNITTLTQTLQDILTAGIISDVEVTPWLLTSLTEKLKSVMSTLSPLVPEGFYLPAPPLYCPQPGEVELVSMILLGQVLVLHILCYYVPQFPIVTPSDKDVEF